MGKRTSRSDTRPSAQRRRLVIERLGQRRVLATITGTVFVDLDHSFQFESAESAAVERLIYIDSNQNAQLDANEPYSLSRGDGSFALPGLDDGTYLVRLFNGTAAQRQTVPFEATIEREVIDVADAFQLEVVGDTAFALTTSSLIIGNLVSGSSQTLVIADQLTRMQLLPNGNVLVIGTDAGGDTAWVVDPDAATVAPVELTGTDPELLWSDVAIDASGGGVLLAQTSGVVYSVNSTLAPIQVTATAETVPAGSQVLTSSTGVLTVLATPEVGGMQLRLWSNQTNSYVQEAVVVAGLTDLLAYDDAAGVLAARGDNGALNLYDTANNFQPLHSISDLRGPIAIDSARDLLITISPGESILKIINLHDGELITNLAIDLSTVGQVAALTLADRHDSVVVLGAAGVTEIALRKSAAHEIVVSDGQDPDPVLFGVSVDGPNTAPTYNHALTLDAVEDTLLELAAPAARAGAFDADGDTFVVLQSGQSTHGITRIGVDGSIRYEPEADFFGTDTVSVRLHDGRDVSDDIMLEIEVVGTPDSPTGISLQIPPLAENITPGTVVGTIEVFDVDGTSHVIELNDPRFSHQNGEIIFVGGSSGGGIDYELEPTIPLSVSATDPETEFTIERHVILEIQDQNDPVTAISPKNGFVDENQPGDIVIELDIQDQDAEQAHLITVDDNRFVVVDRVLRLAPGVQLDYEAESTIVIHITATELPGGGSYTEEFSVTVRDRPEQPQTIDLTNKTVLELEPGAVVGNVSLDGQPPAGNYQFAVNDPRFEVAGTLLKLKDDQYVQRAEQEEIQLEISGDDTGGQFSAVSATLVVDVLVNENPYHNEANPYDVDSSGSPTALDALIIINYMAQYGPGPVGQGDPAMGYDVNGDGDVTALDALLIINQLNNTSTGTVGGSEGEGEQSPIENRRAIAQQSPASQDQPLEIEVAVPNLEPAPPKLTDVSLTEGVEAGAGSIESSDEEIDKRASESVDIGLRLLSDEEF